jgi:hypothetical protein
VEYAGIGAGGKLIPFFRTSASFSGLSFATGPLPMVFDATVITLSTRTADSDAIIPKERSSLSNEIQWGKDRDKSELLVM